MMNSLFEIDPNLIAGASEAKRERLHSYLEMRIRMKIEEYNSEKPSYFNLFPKKTNRPKSYEEFISNGIDSYNVYDCRHLHWIVDAHIKRMNRLETIEQAASDSTKCYLTAEDYKFLTE